MTDRLLVADLNARSRNWALSREGEERLVASAPPGWRIHVVRTVTSSDGDGPSEPGDEVSGVIGDAEVYFGFGAPRPILLAGKKLRWIHSAAAGVGSALYPEMLASDVILTNSAGIHAIPIAEFILGGILHFLRGLDFAIENQRQAKWDKAPFVALDAPMREMDSVRALIIGVAGLGGATAERLTALGARCTGVRRRPSLGTPPGFERIVSFAELDAELPKHNVVILTAPLTPETRDLMSGRRLDLLPPSALLVSVGRGAQVDEDALVERLVAGRLRGAVMDVFREEPLPPSSPLWQLRQVLLMPHTSPVSPGRFWPRQLDLFLDNWSRYSKGEPLRNVVDKHAGY